MKSRLATMSALMLLFSPGNARAGAALQSGPRVGEEVPGMFRVLNLNGPQAGKSTCEFCRNGNNPVAMIFAREINKPLIRLIKQLDAVTAENVGARMGSVVVFLGDEDAFRKQVKDLADHERIHTCIVGTMSTPGGPPKYRLAKEAGVTVILYNKLKVEANFAFEPGKLTDADVDRILGELQRILPK